MLDILRRLLGWKAVTGTPELTDPMDIQRYDVPAKVRMYTVPAKSRLYTPEWQ